MVYSESELIIPALKVIVEYPSGVRTSVIIDRLIRELEPTGQDIRILEGRTDTHFSQKVRNLKSHNTLTNKGFATYHNGIWKITKKGQEYINQF